MITINIKTMKKNSVENRKQRQKKLKNIMNVEFSKRMKRIIENNKNKDFSSLRLFSALKEFLF